MASACFDNAQTSKFFISNSMAELNRCDQISFDHHRNDIFVDIKPTSSSKLVSIVCFIHIALYVYFMNM